MSISLFVFAYVVFTVLRWRFREASSSSERASTERSPIEGFATTQEPHHDYAKEQ
jgi:hypothetical protein